MTTDPIHLLRTLALGGRGAPATVRPEAADSTAFADLLRRAQQGELRSERSVEIDPDVNLDLTAEQLDRLALAADKAEIAGLRTALVMVDGKRFMLDVHQRRITGSAEDAAEIVGGVDGVIDLSPRAPETARGIFGPLVLPGAQPGAGRKGEPVGLPARAENASLLKVLSDLRKAQ